MTGTIYSGHAVTAMEIKNQKKYDDGIIDCCKNDPELMMTFKLKDGKTEISAKDEHNSMAVRTALLIYESFNLLKYWYADI